MKKKSTKLKINHDSLLEKNEKQEQKKKLILHIILILLCVIINIRLFQLIQKYKQQINFSKNENKFLKEEIYNQTSIISYQDKVIQNNLLNLLSYLFARNLKMIDNFHNIDEMLSIFSEGGIKDPLNKYIYLCYKSTYYSHLSHTINQNCPGNEFIIIIRTKNNERFGGFVSYFALVKSFLFHFDKNGVYKKFKINNYKNAYTAKYDIVFGNEDLVIKDEWDIIQYGCYSKFPQSYGNNSNTISDLIGNENPNNIEIDEIEIIDRTVYKKELIF